ncbi:MAG: hypothetical protein BMS9Abin11_1272 [Gammaproteobacteria bacterium]|nr:MAG: hypothetical protein BMS9Abin11_1272 [Gammaproteobacteria bacterium]
MDKPASRQKLLFIVSVILSSGFWLGLVFFAHFAMRRTWAYISLDYVALIVVLAIILVYFIDFIRRARLVAHLKGHTIEIGAKQHPDLYSRLKTCCKRLDIESLPNMYIFSGNTQQKSYALRYQGQQYIAINVDVIAALTDRQGAIDFILGYELARARDVYSRWAAFIYPARVLPLIGPAYIRSCIYSYDAYGIRASKSKVDAAFVLAVYASGDRRWKSLNIPNFAGQSAATREFWMSMQELVSENPWLSKRMAHLRAIATKSDSFIPRHNPLALPLALLVPYLAPFGFYTAVRLLFLALWITVTFFGTIQAYRLLAKHDLLGFSESRFVNKVVNVPGKKRISILSRSKNSKPKKPRAIGQIDPYGTLHTDLKTLGGMILNRQRKRGGNPCEINNIKTLQLNYHWQRYAFSCDEPIVYTNIEQGEFVPGHKAHIQSYNWKRQKMVKGPPRQ